MYQIGAGKRKTFTTCAKLIHKVLNLMLWFTECLFNCTQKTKPNNYKKQKKGEVAGVCKTYLSLFAALIYAIDASKILQFLLSLRAEVP